MVRLPEQKPSLAHLSVASAPTYDPFKAHEYYIRTRKLHPRQAGVQVNRSSNSRLISHPSRPNGAELQKQRAVAAKQVADLQKKLSQLNAALKTALQKEGAAKKSSGKPTAAEKSKKARESKQFRQSHKQALKTKAKQAAAAAPQSTSAAPSGSSQSTASSSNVAKGTSTAVNKKKPGAGSSIAIKAAIAGVQRTLAAAKARQRALG